MSIKGRGRQREMISLFFFFVIAKMIMSTEERHNESAKPVTDRTNSHVTNEVSEPGASKAMTENGAI